MPIWTFCVTCVLIVFLSACSTGADAEYLDRCESQNLWTDANGDCVCRGGVNMLGEVCNDPPADGDAPDGDVPADGDTPGDGDDDDLQDSDGDQSDELLPGWRALWPMQDFNPQRTNQAKVAGPGADIEFEAVFQSPADAAEVEGALVVDKIGVIHFLQSDYIGHYSYYYKRPGEGKGEIDRIPCMFPKDLLIIPDMTVYWFCSNPLKTIGRSQLHSLYLTGMLVDQDNVLYVAGDINGDWVLEAISEDGNTDVILWQLNLDEYAYDFGMSVHTFSAAMSENGFLVVSINNELAGLDKTNGQIVWSGKGTDFFLRGDYAYAIDLSSNTVSKQSLPQGDSSKNWETEVPFEASTNYRHCQVAATSFGFVAVSRLEEEDGMGLVAVSETGDILWTRILRDNAYYLNGIVTDANDVTYVLTSQKESYDLTPVYSRMTVFDAAGEQLATHHYEIDDYSAKVSPIILPNNHLYFIAGKSLLARY